MVVRNVLKVGSRGSKLALRQTEEALVPLRARNPGLAFQVVTVRTQGDMDTTSPLPGMGLGVFVKEIEREILAGELDLAVHSLKDMTTALPEGLALGAVLKRQDPRDVIINRWNCPLAKLPQGARIGTSSPRRFAQIKNRCPWVDVLAIRGNVETRIQKALGESYDGAVLAAAGLVRLDLTQHIAEYLSPQRFVPAPGQAVLALEARADDDWILELLASIEHPETRFAIAAERAFLALLGSGCELPVGAYARCVGEMLLMTVFLGSADGKKAFRAKLEGLTHDPLQLASDAYLAVLERGGASLLGAAKVRSG